MRKIKFDTVHRVETGALQVNDDWAGLFIRGDDCFILRNLLLEYRYKNNYPRNSKHILALKLLSELADVHGEEKCSILGES